MSPATPDMSGDLIPPSPGRRSHPQRHRDFPLQPRWHLFDLPRIVRDRDSISVTGCHLIMMNRHLRHPIYPKTGSHFLDLAFGRRSIYPKTGSHFLDLTIGRRSIYPKNGSHFLDLTFGRRSIYPKTGSHFLDLTLISRFDSL
ncbi:hypothetical protein [Hoeflea sp. TYP-13]|uniref:hypothetical protein n=1 Tax=Hoeflea sp. TYP-13 TaxID=3230023 RepID=UPI0034C6B35D